MGAVPAVIGLPLEVYRDRVGQAIVGRVSLRITAGGEPVALSARGVSLVDGFGATAMRAAAGVWVAGLLEPTREVRLRPHTTTDVAVWFEPIALGTARRCAVVVELVIDGEPFVTRAEAVVHDEGPALAR